MNASMKSTGRFALVLGALAAVFALLLLLAPPAAAQHTGTGMIPTSGGGGGMSTAAADLRYLKLDATNDPLTGALTLPGGTSAAPGLNFTGATNYGIYQTGTGIGFTRNGATNFDVGTSSSFAQFFTAYLLFNSGVGELDIHGGLAFGASTPYPAVSTTVAGNTAATIRTAGALTLFSAANEAGEFAVAAGSSADMASGGILFSIADFITSAGTPNRKFNFYEDGYMQAGAGAVGTPTYSFLLDPNTGIYNSAADTIAFSSGGTLIATVASTGFVPGVDANLSLGTSALSWDTLYAKSFADTAGTARFTALDATTTTLTSTTPVTAGADEAFRLNITTNFAVTTDRVFTIYDNTGATPAEVWAINGSGGTRTGPGSSTDMAIGPVSSENSGIYFPSTTGGYNVYLYAAGTAMLQTNVVNGYVSLVANDLRTSGTAFYSTNNASTGLSLYSAVDGNVGGETAITLGTSDNTGWAANTLLLRVATDVDGTPDAWFTVDTEGDVVADGDLTVTGGDVTVGTVATIGASGIQTDGDLTVDGGDITLNAAAGATVKDTTNDALAVYSKASAGEFGVILGSTEAGTVTTELISVRGDVDGTPNTVFAVMGTGFIAPETYTATVTTASTLPSLLAPTMLLSCNNAAGAPADCAITLNETSAVAGMRQTFVNMNAAASGDTISFTSSAGVQSTPTGGVVLSQYDVIEFVYDGALWVMSSTSGDNVP